MPRLLTYLLLAAGLLLWGINLAYNRPLFLDEANVARNLFDRDYLGLFAPLVYEQYAPPLYLVLAKFFGSLAGYAEWAMRLPALLGGLLGIYGLYSAGRSLRLGSWVWLSVALLFANVTTLRFVTELKPYGLDLGIAALLLALHLRSVSATTWGLVGVVVPWFSLPSVFVLAAVGSRALWREGVRWLPVVVLWLASFAALYFMVLRSSVGSDYLDNFHADYFLTFRPTAVLGLLKRFGQLAFGHTTVAITWGFGLLAVGLWRRERWLLLPYLTAVAASYFHFYSLIDRLLLFALPGTWLLVAVAARWLYGYGGRWGRIALIATAVIALGISDVYRYYLDPMSFSNGKQLAKVYAEAERGVADPLSVPVLDYYLRIRGGDSSALVKRSEIKPSWSGYTIVYDVTTAPTVRAMIQRDAEAAAARGCDMSREKGYRSAVLHVTCPALNSGR